MLKINYVLKILVLRCFKNPKKGHVFKVIYLCKIKYFKLIRLNDNQCKTKIYYVNKYDPHFNIYI